MAVVGEFAIVLRSRLRGGYAAQDLPAHRFDHRDVPTAWAPTMATRFLGRYRSRLEGGARGEHVVDEASCSWPYMVHPQGPAAGCEHGCRRVSDRRRSSRQISTTRRCLTPHGDVWAQPGFTAAARRRVAPPALAPRSALSHELRLRLRLRLIIGCQRCRNVRAQSEDRGRSHHRRHERPERPIHQRRSESLLVRDTELVTHRGNGHLDDAQPAGNQHR